MLQEEKYFMQYVRDKNRNRVGVVVGFPNGDKIGWSKVRHSDGHYMDQFDRERGLNIAVGRAMTGTNLVPPRNVQEVIDIMADRLYRYKNPKVKTEVS